MKLQRFYCSILAALLCTSTLRAQDAPAPQPTFVRIGLADSRQVQDHRLVTGRLHPIRASQVAAEEPGLVIQAPPDAGTSVHLGDILAKLDTQLIDRQRIVVLATLEEAKAAINQAQAQLNEADTTLHRYQDLVESGGVTQWELDQEIRDAQVARAQLATAQAALASRQAELQQLDIRITKMTILAPYNGIITAKSTELGQWLAPGNQVVQLYATQQIDAVLDVPEMIVSYLAQGQPLDITVDALNRSFPGLVHRIVPAADDRGRTFPVLIRIDNPDGSLKPGMSAEALLPIADKIDATTVPRDAVQLTPAGAQVVVNRNGVAEIVPIQLKFTIDDRFVILGPINPGDQLVIEGNERLFPGTPLQPMNPPTDTAPNP